MSAFFEAYLHMALEGSAVIIVMLLARLMFKRMPKRITGLLWMVVLFRLLCPYTVEGPVPAFWKVQTKSEVTKEMEAEGIGFGYENMELPIQNAQSTFDNSKEMLEGGEHPKPVNSNANVGESEQNKTSVETLAEIDVETNHSNEEGNASNSTLAEREDDNGLAIRQETISEDVISLEGTSENAVVAKKPNTFFQGKENLFTVLGFLWLVGALVFLLLGIRKYVSISRKLREAIPCETIEGYRVKKSDYPGLPMVFGLLKPVIFVPFDFEWKDRSKENYIIFWHEAAHVRRGDLLVKCLFFVALCVHWWNPLVWISLRLFDKDLEMACDEWVLRHQQVSAAEYAKVLLQFAAKKNGFVLPAAFGESNTESRIQNVLRYKKVSIGALTIVICLAIILGVCMATKPHDMVGHDTEHQEKQGEEPDIGVMSDKEERGDKEPEKNEAVNSTMTEESVILVNSDEEIVPVLVARLQDKLLAEGKIKEKSEVDYIGYGAQVQTVVEVDPYAPKRKSLYFYSLSETCEVTVYVITFTLGETDKKVSISDMEDRTISDMNTREVLYDIRFPYVNILQAESVLWYRGERIIQLIGEYAKEHNPEKYQALLKPETALSALLGIKGKGEYIPTGTNSGCVLWTMEGEDDEEPIYFTMQREGEFWYPILVYNKYLKIPTTKQDFEMEMKTAREVDEILQCVDAASLRRVKTLATAENVNSKKYDFLLIQELPEEDVALYGMANLKAMVLRVGNDIYPDYNGWTFGTQLLCGDFDGDEQKEYGIKRLIASEPDYNMCYLDVLKIIVDRQSGERKGEIYSLDEGYILKQLDRVTTTLDGENSILRVSVDGTFAFSMSVRSLLRGENEVLLQLLKYSGLYFSNSLDYEIIDGQLYVVARGAMLYMNNLSNNHGMSKTSYSPYYQCQVVVRSPLQYEGNGKFTLGEIQAEGYVRE